MKNKNIEKKIEIILWIILIGFLLYTFAPMIYGRFYYIPKKFAPLHKYATIKEIEKNLGTNLDITEIAIDNKIYKIGKGPLLKWTLPSGPPMYIFNKDETLIDYTLDSGDDPEFRDKWLKDYWKKTSNHALHLTFPVASRRSRQVSLNVIT